ncbi:MAG: hypothetical protein U5L09_17910 [Bacteroidales bacterium]|nr:hypothetical protein [Bacteroidales bacterium]
MPRFRRSPSFFTPFSSPRSQGRFFCGDFPPLAAQRASRPAVGSPGGGRAALFSAAVFWVLAWSRFSWFAPFQPHTFPPLWLSFILAVNALDAKLERRLPDDVPARDFLALFPASAGFWWFFSNT